MFRFVWNSKWLLILWVFSKLVDKFCKSKWNAFCETETTGSKDPNQENKSLAHQCQILHANENWCMNNKPRWVVWIIRLNKYSKIINSNAIYLLFRRNFCLSFGIVHPTECHLVLSFFDYDVIVMIAAIVVSPNDAYDDRIIGCRFQFRVNSNH